MSHQATSLVLAHLLCYGVIMNPAGSPADPALAFRLLAKREAASDEREAVEPFV
jgi:hypothetical protein